MHKVLKILGLVLGSVVLFIAGCVAYVAAVGVGGYARSWRTLISYFTI